MPFSHKAISFMAKWTSATFSFTTTHRLPATCYMLETPPAKPRHTRGSVSTRLDWLQSSWGMLKRLWGLFSRWYSCASQGPYFSKSMVLQQLGFLTYFGLKWADLQPSSIWNQHDSVTNITNQTDYICSAHSHGLSHSVTQVEYRFTRAEPKTNIVLWTYSSAVKSHD